MDDFQKDYLSKLNLLADNYKNRRKELAESRIKRFVFALCRQLFEFDESFDLIMGGGNSGLFMTEITKIVFEKTNLNLPKVITIPIVRYKPGTENNSKELFDNSSLLTLAKEKLEDTKAPKNILFVDDEVMTGTSLRDSLHIIEQIYPNQRFDVTLIAEHHFFEWHYKLSNFSVRFFAYALLIRGLNGNIGYIVNESIFEQIQKIIPEANTSYKALTILLGGGLKNAEEGKPFYDTTVVTKLIEAGFEFEKEKLRVVGEIEQLITEAIVEYNKGKVKF